MKVHNIMSEQSLLSKLEEKIKQKNIEIGEKTQEISRVIDSIYKNPVAAICLFRRPENLSNRIKLQGDNNKILGDFDSIMALLETLKEQKASLATEKQKAESELRKLKALYDLSKEILSTTLMKKSLSKLNQLDKSDKLDQEATIIEGLAFNAPKFDGDICINRDRDRAPEIFISVGM